MKAETQVELLLTQRALAGHAASAPASLLKLLRHAAKQGRFDGDELAWLCASFGVERQQDWPAAPFAGVADGLASTDGYWFCADPVHMFLLQDSFTVTDAVVDDLDAAQAQQLTGALNAHFADDGLRFFAPTPERWYLRLEQAPALHTTPLAQALGRNVQPLMPQGRDALSWHSRLNEMQMLLYAHAINDEREQRGRLPINSLWLWGGGGMPTFSLQPRHVWSRDAWVRGLALAHGGQADLLPASASAWLGLEPSRTGNLIVLDDTRQQATATEQGCLEADWFAPLLQALRDGRLAQLTLHLAYGGKISSFVTRRADLRKFWRRWRGLGEYLG